LVKDNLYLKVAIKAALDAGNYILSKVGKFGRISYKGRINLVTEVDKESEKIIINHIKKSFSDHSFLAEESGYCSVIAEVASLPRNFGVARNDDVSCYKWIIDPLDGTTNFAHGLGIFCVSVGLEENGKPVIGVVYDPTRKEMFFAASGCGAYLNKKRIHVSKISLLSKSLLVTGFAYNIKEARYTNIENFRKFLLISQAVRRTGSAAIDLCYVACARFDGFWEVGLHPWDTAAGSLIVEEAGGELTNFGGETYSHYDKEILASNGKIHGQMLKVLAMTR
jgi:myo-inositol-1(or 4)-monophosphatase